VIHRFFSGSANSARHPAWAWLWVVPLLALLMFGITARAQGRTPETFAPLAEKLLPAVVNVSTTQTLPNKGPQVPMPQFPPGSPFEDFFRDFFDRQQQDPNAPPRRATSLGSGFIIDGGGYVVTNNHVIEGADEITVILQDDTNLKAELVGTDKQTDLALLRIKSPKKLPSVSWGDSDGMRVGDWVVAIGNPFGLGGTVTAGIISARARDINAGPYDDFLQTDAAINRGNSGGPLFNMNGEVIGINTAIFSQTGGSIGIGFAIPANMAKSVIAQLKDGGKVHRGRLGVQIQTVTPEIAESLSLPQAHGALVGVVLPDSPAEKAGLQPGDVITSFDGKEVNAMRSLPRIVAETPVGKKVSLSAIRKGEKKSFQVVIDELKEEVQQASTGGKEKQESPQGQTVEAVGLSLTALTPQVRQQFNINDQSKGVVITKVNPNGPAQARGLRPGDVIVEVGQEPVASPSDVADRVKKAKDSGMKALLLLVDRQGELQFLALNIG
jgi:serine protease Do